MRLIHYEFPVQFVLKQMAEIDGGAACHALVDEIAGPAINNEHADISTLDHTVEIAGPLLLHNSRIERQACRERIGWRLLLSRQLPERHKAKPECGNHH